MRHAVTASRPKLKVQPKTKSVSISFLFTMRQWSFGKLVTMGTVDKSAAEGGTGETPKASRGCGLGEGYPLPKKFFAIRMNWKWIFSTANNDFLLINFVLFSSSVSPSLKS
jgi:hypothetical protein